MRQHSNKYERSIRATLSSSAALELLVNLSRFATAVDYQRAARRDESRGYPLTAAYELRHAAELFADNAMADQCWTKWEALMGIPRALSHPI